MQERLDLKDLPSIISPHKHSYQNLNKDLATTPNSSIKKKFITTPIYYVNDIPHIGHAYTTIVADMLKKYYSLKDYDVFLLTGTDENGQKIAQAAQKANISPKDFVDKVSIKFKEAWDIFNIDYDKFMRTTNKEHIYGSQKAFLKMYQRGDIYKGEYCGRYCVSCESFYTDTQLVEEIYCPDCGKETMIIKEESYFFALSKYQDKLLEWYKNTNCILPLHKKNEVIKFVEGGLQDLSITRTNFNWGISLPSEIQISNEERIEAKENRSKHIMYVWLDALMNYVNALGYGLDYQDAKENLKNFINENPTLDSKMEFFNHAIHVVGKDILKFHAIFWPAFLMSLELPLPEKIYAHGWWTIDGVKMSKSIGNVINPLDIKSEFSDSLFRYFLLKEVPFGQDGDFSKRALINRNNGELSNDLGNLLNRLIGMSEKYFSFNLENSFNESNFKGERESVNKIILGLDAYMENVAFNKYLDNLWELFYLANNLITQNSPWELIKKDTEKTKNFLNLIANILAKSTILLYPIMPAIAQEMGKCLGITIDCKNYNFLIENDGYIKDFFITKVDALFPKIETEIKQDLESKNEICLKKSKSIDIKAHRNDINTQNLIKKELFDKVELKIGTIIKAEEIKNSNNLLKLQIDLNENSPRQIISGIKKYYKIDELKNTQVLVISNLDPVKIRGEMSFGMILTSEEDGQVSILSPLKSIKNGSLIK